MWNLGFMCSINDFKNEFTCFIVKFGHWEVSVNRHTCERRAEWTAWSGQCCCCRCPRWAESRGLWPLTPGSPASWCCSACPCSGSGTSAGYGAVGSDSRWGWWGFLAGPPWDRGPERGCWTGSHRIHWPGPGSRCRRPGRWASGSHHLTCWRGRKQLGSRCRGFSWSCQRLISINWRPSWRVMQGSQVGLMFCYFQSKVWSWKCQVELLLRSGVSLCIPLPDSPPVALLFF